jgi:hypothetical protein
MKKEHDLAAYWTGIHNALSGRLSSVKDYLRHPSSGVNAENYFRDLLTDYLPKRYAVESGFVVNARGARTDFIDILIVDSLDIAPLSAEPHFKIFPAEAVVGAIEITSAPKSFVKRSGIPKKVSKLADDALRLAHLREIARSREYFSLGLSEGSSPVGVESHELSYDLAPRCFMITFGDEWSKADTYIMQLTSALNFAKQYSGHVWLNAALSLRHGMYHFRPYTEFSPTRFKTNALLEFVLYINRAISSVPTGRIDVRRYRPTTPDEAE